MSSSVRAVTFDLWQTLMHDGREQGAKRAHRRAERIHQALRRAGRKLPLEHVESTLRELWEIWEVEYWAKDVDPGFEAQLAWLRQRFGLGGELEPPTPPSPGVPGKPQCKTMAARPPDEAMPELEAELRAGYVDPIFEVPPEVDAEALPVLRSLRARGFKLGLICNTSVTPGDALRRLLDGWGLGPLLDAQLFSDELGIRKPAPAIFREAARRLGADISAVVHVGDRPDVDVDGAIAAGARGLLARPDAPLSKLLGTLTSN
jgi:FMN phosphatase YigB (HAD superfamily)